MGFLWGWGIHEVKLGINPNLWESGCLKLKIFDIPVEITFIKFGKPKNIFPVAAKLFSWGLGFDGTNLEYVGAIADFGSIFNFV